jgi:hypothetical protein
VVKQWFAGGQNMTSDVKEQSNMGRVTAEITVENLMDLWDAVSDILHR